MINAYIKDNELFVNGIAYKIRYATEKVVVCLTDKLFGIYGDEFPKRYLNLK